MANSTLALALPPLPPLPPPSFPQSFSDRDAHDVSGLEPAGSGSPRARVRVGTGPWQLKTDAEQHVETLETKLAQLTRSNRCDNEGMRPLGPAEPGLAQLQDHECDASYDFGDDGEAAGHDEERTALLSIAEDDAEQNSAALRLVTDEELDNEADLSGNDDDARPSRPFDSLTAAQRISFSNSVRISGGIHSRPHRHRHRIPVEPLPRRSPSNERSNPLVREARPETAPSPLLVASVTSSSANTPSRATSPVGRTPAGSLNVLAPRPRRLSSSSHVSSTLSHPSYAYYSASPGSQVPSRGSSPCSSIYAPLQPPSKHTPNPLFVRPSPRLQRQRSGSSGLSFQEYLREGYDAFDGSDEDDSDVAGGGGASRPPGYRELVERQQRKRAEWEDRRRQRIEDKQRSLEQYGHNGERLNGLERGRGLGGQVRTAGFWTRFTTMLTGIVSGSDATATGSFGTGIGRAGGSLGSPTVFRPSARPSPSSRPSYGATRSKETLPSRPTPRLRPLAETTMNVPQPRSILTRTQPRSDPAFSSNPPASPPSIPPRPPRPRNRSSSVGPMSQPLRDEPDDDRTPLRARVEDDKSQLDARFGPTPFRYLSISFLKYKLERFVDAVRAVFGTARKGFERQKERQRLLAVSTQHEQQQERNRREEERGRYQAV